MKKLLDLYIKDKENLYKPIKKEIDYIAFRSAVLFLNFTPFTVGNMMTAWTIYSVAPIRKYGDLHGQRTLYNKMLKNQQSIASLSSLQGRAKSEFKQDITTNVSKRKIDDDIVIQNSASVDSIYSNIALEGGKGKVQMGNSDGMDNVFSIVTNTLK